MEVKNLKPTLLWHYFDEITRIPRPSKHEARIVDYIEKFAQSHNLSYKRDKIGNIVISKPATAGFENMPKIILQSHVDMVCEKIASSTHDFLTDPIETIVEGNFVRANGTTLGADDGIGVATELAILASDDIKHCAIDCMFTVDEETGLTGANAIEKSYFDGNLFINLDSEEDNIIYIGCAGGCTTQARYTVYERPTSQGMLGIKINILGLKGGHSGTDIHFGRGNAIRIAARFIKIASRECGFELADIVGGKLHNSIPREATIIGVVPFAQRENIRVVFNMFSADIQDELKNVDPNIDMRMETTDMPERIYTSEFSNRLVTSLLACPHGVLGMSHEIPGLVETSTNLASIKRVDSQIVVGTSQRSSVESAKEYVRLTVTSVFELAGAEVVTNEGYPAWQPDTNSELLSRATQIYRQQFSSEPIVTAIHAGLECGLFAGKCNNLDMISIGPNLYSVHTPNECVDIASVEKFWKFVNELISFKN